MRQMSGNSTGPLRGVVVVMVAAFGWLLVAAPAGAQDDGGAYVESNTTVFADGPEPTAVASAEYQAPSAASSSELPQTLPLTGRDAAQVAVIGAFALLAGIAASGWRRRTASA